MKDEFLPIAERVRGYWEMPLLMARQRAHQSLNLGQFQHHNDTWFPKKLAQGHIIQALMPTQFDARFDEREMWPRNCLVLGIDVDRKTAEPVGLKLVRFSYNTNDPHPYEFEFNPADYRFLINGFRKDAVLRTGKIEAIPLDAGRTNYYTDAMGWVDPSVFPEIEEALDKGYQQHRQKHEHVNFCPYDLETVVCVPSLDPSYYNKPYYDFGIPDENFGTVLSDLPKEEQSRLMDRLKTNYMIREIQRPDELRHEKAEIRGEKIALKHMSRRKKKFLASRLYNHDQNHVMSLDEKTILREEVEEILSLLQKEEKEVIPEETDIWNDGETRSSPRKSNIVEFRDMLYGFFGLDTPQRQTDLSSIFSQSIDPQSIKDLETFGIGGLVRDEAFLPEHLWRGRYMMVKVGDITNPHCKNEAYRPAAVWKAYAKLDDEGHPVLAGLELHPCTRQSAHDSKYKMPVYPFGWISDQKANKKQTFLLADHILRLPLESDLFRLDSSYSNFRELTPQMVEKFDHKITRAWVEEQGQLTIIGLKEIPDDWIEIKLPDPPNEDIQRKLTSWKKADFLPVKSPRPK